MVSLNDYILRNNCTNSNALTYYSRQTLINAFNVNYNDLLQYVNVSTQTRAHTHAEKETHKTKLFEALII